MKKKMDIDIKEDIENVLRKMCAARNYREWSEDTIDTIYPYIKTIIEDDYESQEDEEHNQLIIDEDMVITAMLMTLCNE